MSYVVIQCGSKARGDENVKSDTDYVCIHSNNFNNIKLLKSRYPNISFLSIETVVRMKEKGSLFLTHIDIDGIRIEGDESFLSYISGFRPLNCDIRKSLEASRRFLRLLDWFPNSDLGKLWLFDVLFVSLRNIVYCTNALNSTYKFGYKDALVAFGLDNRSINEMLKIRDGKYNFRLEAAKSYEDTPTNLKTLLDVASRVSSVELNCVIGGITDWQRQWEYDYWDERLIERAIINGEIQDEEFRKKLVDHNYFKRSLTINVKEIIYKAIHRLYQ